MSELITIHIDGAPYQVPAGMNLVDAARIYANVEIPIFCYHPKLEAVGMCRMCLVDIGFEQRDRQTGELLLNPDGTPQVRWGPKLDTACTNVTRPGMYIRTTTDKVQEARRDVLEFLLSSHPLDCPICDKGGECPLQNLTMRHGPGTSRMYLTDKMHLAKHYPLGDLIFLDRERCIQCARCTRFQAEIVGDDVLAFHERGRRLQIVTVSDPPFDTYFSGNTTDICPVGALTTADFRFGARPWELDSVPTICPHCPVGCNMVAQTRLDRDSGGVKVIKRILPRQNEAVNEIWICDKGRFGHHHSQSPARLTAPLIRNRRGKLVEATWEQAFNAAAEGLRAAGSSVGVVAGPMLSNEDLWALRELASGLGSERLGLWPATLGDTTPVDIVGVGSGTDFTRMGQGDAILVIATDLEEEAPLWFLQVKQAADRGAALIVANIRPAKLDRYASAVIRYAPGEAVDLLNSLTAAAISKAWTDKAFVEERVKGLDKLAASLKGMRQPYKGPAETLATAANLVIVAGNDGLTPDEHTALLQSAANILIVTGHVGKANNGLLPVWPGANTQGALDLGFTAAATRTLLAEKPAALIAAGAALATDSAWTGALTGDGFLVYLTLFRDETAEHADVVLPMQSFAERDGTFTSGMRRVQRFYQAHGPVGLSLPAWEAIALIGQRLGQAAPRNGPALVMKALAAGVKAYAHISYPALAQAAPQTPPIGISPGFYGGSAQPPKGGTGIQLPVRAEGRGKLTVRPVKAPKAASRAEDELLILPVRRLYDRAPEFAASALMHGRIPQPFVGLNRADADRLGIADGDAVKLHIDGAALEVMAVVDDEFPEGAALLPVRLSDAPTPFTPVAGVVEKITLASEVAVGD